MDNKRLSIIDFLRGFAVILMFITHSYRLQIQNIDSWLPNQIKLDHIFQLFMIIEPFTSALFLFLVGYSFSMVQHKNNVTDIIKKTLLLISLSWFINIIQYIPKGFFLDHLFLSSGILQAISIAILINWLCVKPFYLYIATLITVLAEIILEYNNLSILGLNAGSGCLIPVIGYSFIGNLSHKNLLNNKLINFGLIIISCFFLLIQLDLKVIINYQIFDILSNKYVLFENWNHSAVGFLINSVLLVNLIKIIKKINIPDNFIIKLGSNSLTVYVYHLIVISLFYYNSWGLSNPTETLIFILFLIVSSIYLIKLKLFLVNFRKSF